MTELPASDPHEVIHLGAEAAVVVPLAEYRQLRHDALRARFIEQADTDEAAALAEYREQRAAGFLADDPEGLAQVLDAADGLADEPRPSGAFRIELASASDLERADQGGDGSGAQVRRRRSGRP